MIRAALEDLDLSAVLAAYLEQAEKYGHTAETDAELPLCRFADELVRRAHEAADVIRPGDHQRLDVAYRRCAREAALALSTMRRIRTEKGYDRGADCAEKLRSTDQ